MPVQTFEQGNMLLFLQLLTSVSLLILSSSLIYDLLIQFEIVRPIPLRHTSTKHSVGWSTKVTVSIQAVSEGQAWEYITNKNEGLVDEEKGLSGVKHRAVYARDVSSLPCTTL